MIRKWEEIERVFGKKYSLLPPHINLKSIKGMTMKLGGVYSKSKNAFLEDSKIR